MAPDATPDAAQAPTPFWQRPLVHVPSSELSTDTAQTAGMRRYEALSGKRTGARNLWFGQNRMQPGKVSAAHHHAHAESGIYVVSGHPAFVFLVDGEERRVDGAPGDYFYVPPFVPHREENPSADEDAVLVVVRTTPEDIAIGLPDLHATPELPPGYDPDAPPREP